MFQRKKRLVTDYLIMGVILSSFAMIILSFYIDIQTATYFLFLNIVLSIGSYFMLMRSGHKYLYWAGIVIIFALMHYVLFSSSLKLVDTLIFISIICFAAVVSIRPLDAMNHRVLYWGAVICSIQLILTMNESQYYSENHWLQYVYINSNTAATVALNLLACIAVGAFRFRKKRMWLFSAVLAGCVLYIIYLTHSRSSFLASLLMLGLLGWNHFIPQKEKLAGWLLCAPLLAVPIVTSVFQLIFRTDAVWLGKTLFSGREQHWIDAIGTIWSNLIHVENAFTTGLNTALRLPYLCGIVGTVVYFIYYRSLAKDICRSTMTEGKLNPAVLVLGTLFVQQSFESTIISGSYCIAYISMAILGTAAWLGEKR